MPLSKKGQSRPAVRPAKAPPSFRRNSKVARWGNSLAFRIPQEAAEQLNLRDGGQVSVEIHADSITIRPVRPARKKWSEADLLKGVTPDAVGGEVNWGKPIGKEAV